MAAGIPSDFPPPDARPRGTRGNRQGHRVTADAVGRPFGQVTGDDLGQAGMGRDARGNAAATCKTAGFAYTGSNPVPATPPLTCGNAVAIRWVMASERPRFPSDFPPPDAVLTPTARPASH